MNAPSPVAAVCDRRPINGGSGRAATGVASQREATHLTDRRSKYGGGTPATHLCEWLLLAVIALAFTGCASKPVGSAQSRAKPQRTVAPPSSITVGTAAERLDKSRLELEEYKQAQRERYFRLQQKRLAEQHALPPEMPEVKLVSGASAGRTGQRSAADRADDWQRENAELRLAERLRAVHQYQLKVRQHHNLPPEWLDERNAP